MATAYMSVLGHDSLRKTRDANEPLVRLALGNNFDQVGQLLGRTGTLRSTREAEQLRNELMKLIRNAAQQKPPAGKKQPASGDPGNKGDTGTDSGQAMADQKNEPDATGKDGGKQSSPSQTDGSSGAAASGLD